MIVGDNSGGMWTTSYRPSPFVEVITYNEEGEEAEGLIAIAHIVSISKGDGVTRIDTIDGVTHYVAHTYQDVMDKLGKVLNGPY